MTKKFMLNQQQVLNNDAPPIQNTLVWQSGQVSANDRARLLGQKPVTLWLTGLSGAGKSTIAYAVERRLVDLGQACFVLDGDNVRHGLNRDLGFSPEDRSENIRRVAEVAKLMNEAGLIVISAFISPYREDRDLAHKIIGQDCFKEIYVNTSLQVCEQRDTKGLYKRAREGKVAEFTGVTAPYEAPVSPALAIDTATTGLETSVTLLMALLSFSGAIAAE